MKVAHTEAQWAVSSVPRPDRMRSSKTCHCLFPELLKPKEPG